MLIDKGYYDYDFEEPKTKKGRNISKGSDPDKLKAKLTRLGIGATSSPLSAEDIQRMAMAEVRESKDKR